MSSVQNPTYLLAPNWTFRPGGKIALGNIVVDPFKPHRVLSAANPAEIIPAEPVVETNWTLALGTARSMSLSIWAVFLENIRLGTDINRERIRNSEFTMASLETVYLKDDPSEAEIKARCNEEGVRDFMRLGHTLCKPVCFEAEGGVIFAYQLHKISPKGWGKKKTLVVTEYQPRQAFLSSEEAASSEDEPVQ
ncbi:hypothetical protein CMUS01_11057 [Colletotrichum musicola]|uniref:Uncharacterized protein n=1 Tax=Colletotrichum musicola TaxID=2175873 RepID=A0A8H6K134_9PEZI|nr:hypothetical protein CMUS01_11057 [Colletotrichum musicola]